MTPCVVFQVSQPYSSTDVTFELKSLIFVEIEILDAFHTLLRLAKAVLAFPILVLTSASVYVCTIEFSSCYMLVICLVPVSKFLSENEVELISRYY